VADTTTAHQRDPGESADAFGGIGDAYLTGQYAPVHDERHDTDLHVVGELPPGLRGAYLRNGPNPYFPPPGRYHVFDGDGMVHGVWLDGEGRASYRNRWVRSHGLVHEQRVGHAVYGGLSEFHLPDDDTIRAGGVFKNTANTNVVRHAGRVFALMEGARPTELDPATLDTIGEHDFGGALDGAFTAHPKWDPASGELLSFGYSPFPPYLRCHVTAADGTMIRSTEVPIDRPVMMHDVAVTEHWVVWFDLPALFDGEAMMTGGTAIRWRPELGARIGVMPREGNGPEWGAGTRWFDVDPFYVFHFMNAWEETGPDGGTRLVVDGCRSAAMPTAFGDDPTPDAPARPYLWRWEIDLASGTVRDRQLDDRTGDFPRIDDRRGGRPNRFGTWAHSRSWGDRGVEFDGVLRIDHAVGSTEQYLYGPTHVCGEAAFAPDPDGAGEGDGWLLNLVTDLATDRSEFVVLDARDLGSGPVARVLLPRRVPFGFHGNWLAATD
jgi:carotenoid cleavage dioxygenase-like enzyme